MVTFMKYVVPAIDAYVAADPSRVAASAYGPDSALWAEVQTLETLDYDAASRVVRTGPQGALSKKWVDAYTGKASNAVSEERYSKTGKHMGEFDPKTGEQLKPADPSRKVER